MSSENDENQAKKPEELTFILAIAGRIDARSRIIAIELHKNREIYYAYAVTDALSTSYSMFKYAFDLFISPTTNNDLMHECLLTPTGIVMVTLESIFLVTYAVLAVHFENETEDGIKKSIATSWPYFRAILKALKNAYKGWRSAMNALHLIGGLDVQFLVAPAGLILGIFAAANRFWLQGMLEERKTMMNSNAKLLLAIQKRSTLTRLDRKLYLKDIDYQTLYKRRQAFVSVAVGGFVDGLYLYMGVLNVAILAPQFFLAMAIICAFFTVACILTRLYEEYDFQHRLIITQLKCKLALLGKELQTSYSELLVLEAKLDKTELDLIHILVLRDKIGHLFDSFDKKRDLYFSECRNQYLSAFLLGMKNGLYGYSALTSILFLISAILLLSGTAFPPALLISFVFFGLALVIGITIVTLISNTIHNHQLENQAQEDYEKFLEIKKALNDGTSLDGDAFQNALTAGLNFFETRQLFFQEGFEVIRSLFSGLGKGQKFTDFAGNPLQELNEQGHYHDTPILYVLGFCNAILFGVIMMLRALAKGFGRKPPGTVEEEEDIELIPQESVEPSDMKKISEEVVNEVEISEVIPARSKSALSNFSLFNSNKKQLRRSYSDSELMCPTPIKSSIIQGLS